MGDQAILICLKSTPNEKSKTQRYNRMITVRLLADRLQMVAPFQPGWPREFVIGYDSVLAPYDANLVSFKALRDWLKIQLERIVAEWQISGLVESVAPESHQIPVVYNGADLRLVANRNKISTNQVIELHSSVTYTVYLLGFAPGFAYLGPLPAQIDTPRLAQPRLQVAAGSVGLAAGLTGVYPFQMPGGWNIIGTTDLPMFENEKNPPVRFLPGDTVRFYPV